MNAASNRVNVSNGVNPSPKIFIVVLNYNGRDVLLDCLASIFRIDYPNFEVIVVDNNSQDGSLEAARLSYSRVSYIKNEENLGFARGSNVGIKYALEKMTDWVLLLNNDTRVDKHFLRELIDAVQENKNIGIASPLIMKNNGPEVWFSGGEINWLRMKVIHNSGSSILSSRGPSFITGCAMLVKSDVFKKIGLFDERFFLYWEDADFVFRARRAGFSTSVISDSVVYHYEKSEKNVDKKTYWLVFSGLLFFAKNTPVNLKLWMKIYLALRMIKNWIDIHYQKDKRLALIVNKAYQDFKNAKKIQ